MQFQRMMLFTALGLVLVIIWQSWVEFQNERQANPSIDSPVASNGTNARLSEDVPDAPKVVATQDSNNTDVVESVVEEALSRGRIINVATDLINAQIDTQGGDLIRVELLKHPVSVDTPDEPFVLMHRDAPDLFVAQSGLIGNDREYPNHNVLFSATQFEYQLRRCRKF